MGRTATRRGLLKLAGATALAPVVAMLPEKPERTAAAGGIVIRDVVVDMPAHDRRLFARPQPAIKVTDEGVTFPHGTRIRGKR